MHRSRLELDADGDLVMWRYIPDESSDEPDVELVVIGDPYDVDEVGAQLWALASDAAEYDRLDAEFKALAYRHEFA